MSKLLLNILLVSRILDRFGTVLNMMAINILLLALGGSADSVALAMGLRLGAGILASPVIAFLSDRFSKKILIVATDLLLGFAVIGALLVSREVKGTYLLCLMVFIGALGSTADVSFKSAISFLVEEKARKKFNGIYLCGSNVFVAVAGLLPIVVDFGRMGYETVFVIDAVSYWFAGLAALGIPGHVIGGRGQGIQLPKMKVDQVRKFSLISSIKEDLGRLAAIPDLATILFFLFLLFLDACASASHNIGFPIFSRQFSQANPMFLYGCIIAGWGFGNVLGFVVLETKRLSVLSVVTLYPLFTGIMSLGFICLFQTNQVMLVVLFATMAGLGDGTYQTIYSLYLQGQEKAVQGKLFSMTSATLYSGLFLGVFLFPLVVKRVPLNWAVIGFHGVVVTVVVVFFAGREFRRQQKWGGGSQPALADR